MLAAIAVRVSAAVHLFLWFDAVREEDVIGAALMLNAVGGAVIAVLLGWRHWVPPFLALGFGLSTLSAFVISHHSEALRRQCHLGRLGGLDSGGGGGSRRGGDGCLAPAR